MKYPTWIFWSEECMKLSVRLDDTINHKPSHSHYLTETEYCYLLCKFNDRADEICRQFIATGEWPQMTDYEKYAIQARLKHAHEFTMNLYFAEGPRSRVVVRPPDLSITPTQKVWEFLLIKLWETNMTRVRVISEGNKPGLPF